MKEIGEKLKITREEQGVSVEEAASDLNLRVSQIENIEAGNLKAFKDVFYLKYFIRDYAKYLGLDEEEIIDEFNEYFFTATSKIPIVEIEKASNTKKKEQKKEKVVSPYTLTEKTKSKLVPIIVGLIIALLIILIVYIVVTKYFNPTDEDNLITYLRVYMGW